MSSILEARNITKIYPGTVALDDVSVTFRSGEVHALVGKNGSGKSTLLKIISGAVLKTKGSIILDGQNIDTSTPHKAFELGIATVYQEMSVLPALTVGENIFLGHLPTKMGRIDWEKVYSDAQLLLDDLGIAIDSHATIASLSIGERQMVEIAKAMIKNPKVLQLDEPTSAITTSEVQALFRVVRRLKEKGVIVVYVSHKLHELWEIADVCTVFRDGHYIGTERMENISHADLVYMMFGDVEVKTMPKDLLVEDQVVLEVKDLCYKNRVNGVSVKLYKGEILGIAGMLGSGRTELLSCIFGAEKADSGEIILFGESVKNPTPNKMKRKGMAMTTENRQQQGLVLFQSIRDNLVTACIETTGKGFTYDNHKADACASQQERELHIKVSSLKAPVSSLSGGNQQKVVVGNWLNTSPKVILFDEPSRGIDVNAKQQIFEIMWNQSRKGISSLIVSTELEELLEVCHRILVIKDGSIVGEIQSPQDYTVEEIYSACMGGIVK